MPKKAKPTTITQALKQAINGSGQSDYAIAKGSGVPQPIITRFHNGTRDTIHIKTADKIAAYLGYSLVPDKRHTPLARPARKPAS